MPKNELALIMQYCKKCGCGIVKSDQDGNITKVECYNTLGCPYGVIAYEDQADLD